MKILLAGMNYMPNQFSRAIEALGCEVVHTSGDPGAFPRFCEAAVIAKCQISHQKMWDVKEHYAGRFFMSDNFSTIKERFEAFVNQRRDKVNSSTAVGAALTQATRRIIPSASTPKVNTAANMDRIRSLRGSVPQAAKELIAECWDAGISISETSKMCVAEGFKRQDGSPYTNQQIANFRTEIKHKRAQGKGFGSTERTQSAPDYTRKGPEATKPPTKVRGALDIIGKILAAQIPQARKIALIESAQRGEVTAEESVRTRELQQGSVRALELTVSSIYRENDFPVVSLTKAQAIAVIRAIGDVRRFAEAE